MLSRKLHGSGESVYFSGEQINFFEIFFVACFSTDSKLVDLHVETVVFRVLLGQEFIELLIASNQFGNLSFVGSTELFDFSLRFVLWLGSLDLVLIFLVLETESFDFALKFSNAISVLNNNLSGLAGSASSSFKFNVKLSVVVLEPKENIEIKILFSFPCLKS